MSYDPSHRRPPRQERWPNATPPEGWPPYRDGEQDGGRYGADRLGAYPAAAGHRGQDGYQRDPGGYGGGYRSAVVTDDFPRGRHAGGSHGYTGAADDFPGYGTATEEFPGASGYGWTEDGYREDPNGYAEAADDFAGTAGYRARDRYAGPAYSDPMLVAPDAGVRPGEWQGDRDSRREAARRGLAVSAVTGFLAVAVAIGVSTLATAMLRSQVAPVSAVTGVFIDRMPAALRNLAAQQFGAHAVDVLLLGAYGAIALLAIIVGMLARRAAALGVAGLAAFSLLAALVTVTRPGGRAADAIPAAIGGLAGAVALAWLVRASAPAEPLRYARGARRRAW